MNNYEGKIFQLTASEASNDETDFLAWWFQSGQDKLRTHCSPNWALIIWKAALKSKQGGV